ncbi:MAG: hypothetical protein DYG93_02575 [Leptolyngbya sp. PLA2]|nr:hypothetical protein [Leptolyngbya sp. PL-A2]MCQ3940466.1 hypothetical protein [cyanobacterium CYA1]MCZ7633930.1 hypothetical protein [Phycisphaerales bacterium]MDL1904316.1 hypothetical protein [Synechococcales cyanobacterium CNB]GIK19546.1 MAG: transcriptional regulator MraZ [Planctomycetota bacterium]
MRLIGLAEVTIDGKGRLAVPAKFRSALGAETDARTWVSMPRDDGTIRLYPIAEFTRLSESMGGSLLADRDETEVHRILFGFSEEIETDAAGRLILPRRHVELTGMPNEVVVIGAGRYLEVHSRAEWSKHEAARLSQLQEYIARVRRSGAGGGS